MNFSALSGNDRTAAIAAVVVIVFGILSIVLRWGILMAFPVLAGLVVLFVLFQTQVAPNTRLPMARGILLLGAGGVAVVVWVLVALQWLGYIFGNLISFDVIQFAVGLAGAVVLALAGWRAYSAEAGSSTASSPPPAPPAPPAA
jgi:hypothetical protein